MGEPKKLGIVLTGGGARAAYQVGVLSAIAELIKSEKNPFSVISGYSAGAVNGAYLASRKGSFKSSTRRLWETWAGLTAENVFNVGTYSLGRIALTWVRDRGLGGLINKKSQITYLLDTAPLRKLIEEKINFKQLNANIENRYFRAVAFSATDYRTGHSVAFYNGSPDIKDWKKLNRMSSRTQFTCEHIMASSAIPFFFPPVRIGNSFYGDGMVRMNSPLSSAIHLGADKLLVIGIRGPSSAAKVSNPPSDSVSVGEIAGTVLNGFFFDSLDADIDRMGRVNRALAVLNPEGKVVSPEGLRPIPLLSLNPSMDLVEPSGLEMHRMPATLRFFLKGIGITEGRGSDLLSYLAFEPKFITSLLEAGYTDTIQKKDDVLHFFES